MGTSMIARVSRENTLRCKVSSARLNGLLLKMQRRQGNPWACRALSTKHCHAVRSKSDTLEKSVL